RCAEALERKVQAYNSPSAAVGRYKRPPCWMKRFVTRPTPFMKAEQMSVSSRKLNPGSPDACSCVAAESIQDSGLIPRHLPPTRRTIGAAQREPERNCAKPERPLPT